MPVKLLLMLVLIFAPHGYATEAELPLDLIEMLGELDDEDSEVLAAAMSEIESNSSKQTPHTKEVKK